MTGELTVKGTSELATLSENARRYAGKARSANTLRAYSAALREFDQFALSRGESPLPAATVTVIEYITALADRGAAVNTIGVKLAAIAFSHRVAQLPDPTVFESVKVVMSGIRRAIGCSVTKKTAATLEGLRAMLETLPQTARGMRNRAILLVGFAGAFRRSELAALDVADVSFTDESVTVTLRQSKTDQDSEGLVTVIPAMGGELCPVQSLLDWLNVAQVASGAVFRGVDRHGNVKVKRLTAQSIALVVKEAAKAAGLDWRSYSAHSLRSGFVTSAKRQNASDSDVMEVTHHKSVAQMREYSQASGVGARRAVHAAFGVG